MKYGYSAALSLMLLVFALVYTASANDILNPRNEKNILNPMGYDNLLNTPNDNILNPGNKNLLNPDGRQELLSGNKQDSTMTLDLCRFISRNAESGFLDPEYKSENDLKGKSVEGVNIQSNQTIVLPKEYKFSLFLDLAERAGVQLPEGFEAEGVIGEIRFDQHDIFLNDQKLTEDELSQLKTFCHNYQKETINNLEAEEP